MPERPALVDNILADRRECIGSKNRWWSYVRIGRISAPAARSDCQAIETDDLSCEGLR